MLNTDLKGNDVSKLISGKEALIALANGEDVQLRNLNDTWYNEWTDYSSFKFKTWIGFFIEGEGQGYEFRLKPRTIKIGEFEVPAPFEPEVGDSIYFIDPTKESGWSWVTSYEAIYKIWIQFGAWRSEEEIVQVVPAVRSMFNGK